MRNRIPSVALAVVLFLLIPAFSQTANAGVFNIPKFVEPGKFAVGGELEGTFTNFGGLGLNAKYTHGLTDLLNIQGELGGGFGAWNFRVGSALIIDFFPDIDKQPGIGIAAHIRYGIYRNLTHVFIVQAMPYIHKAFQVNQYEIDPYLAIPIGMHFSNGFYNFLGTLAIGTQFKPLPKWSFNFELGIGWWTADTTISTGFTYYH
jgi:hypothetical protein